jgi:hypothetical protein
MNGGSDVPLTPAEQQLKSATRALIRAFGGTEPAGLAAGQRQQAVSEMQSRSVPRFMPLNMIAVLEDSTAGLAGHPHITRHLAERQGFTLVRLPDAVPSDGDLLILMAQLAGSYGEITREICEALADGRVEADEAHRVRALLRRQIDIAVQMDAVLAAIEGGEA